MIRDKKAVNEVGIGIVVLALLLFLGGLFFDSDFETVKKEEYIDERDNNIEYSSEESYLFFLNETDLGRQKKVTESFPNIELGSKIENNIIHRGSSFRLLANPFTKSDYTVTVNPQRPADVNELLLYFNPERISGDNPLKIMVNGQIVATTLARESDIPITIPMQNSYLRNYSGIHISFEVDKPKFYSIFNWNKMEVQDLQVVEVKQDKQNNFREFSFQVDRDNFLERVFLQLAIECNEVKSLSPAIKVTINNQYIVSNANPDCTSRYLSQEIDVPLNILNDGVNTLQFETEGFYTVGYSVNKIEFNDKDIYKFTINNFNDIIDVVMYGDFDKEVIDLRINSQTLSLRRDEIVSIIPYLKFGTNEIKFLTKPLEIEEFVIEKNEFLY